MIAGFDCSGNLWRVFIPAEYTDSRAADCAASVNATGWVSSRTAIVGEGALRLRATSSTESTFTLKVDSSGLTGTPYEDDSGRIWSVEAQAALVLRKLSMDCLRISGSALPIAVLAVPEGFQDSKTMLRAAWMADVKVQRMVRAREAGLYSVGQAEVGKGILLIDWDCTGFHAITGCWSGTTFVTSPAYDRDLSSCGLVDALYGVALRKVRLACGNAIRSRETPVGIEDAALRLGVPGVF